MRNILHILCIFMHIDACFTAYLMHIGCITELYFVFFKINVFESFQIRLIYAWSVGTKSRPSNSTPTLASRYANILNLVSFSFLFSFFTLFLKWVFILCWLSWHGFDSRMDFDWDLGFDRNAYWNSCLVFSLTIMQHS